MTADDVIKALGLGPHPEGGHFREIFRDAAPDDGGRGAATSIYYLLAAGERSHWHRVDAVEIWHFHAGDPLVLSLSPDGRARDDIRLSADIQAGHRPQAIVPAGCWQSAEPAPGGGMGWTLVGCTVAPAFEFAGFEMAAPGWAPSEDGG